MVNYVVDRARVFNRINEETILDSSEEIENEDEFDLSEVDRILEPTASNGVSK